MENQVRTAISKQETIDAATVSKDNCCELGKWLHGEAKSEFGNFASHSECVSRHAAFHVEAGKVAVAINQKKICGGGKNDSFRYPVYRRIHFGCRSYPEIEKRCSILSAGIGPGTSLEQAFSRDGLRRPFAQE